MRGRLVRSGGTTEFSGPLAPRGPRPGLPARAAATTRSAGSLASPRAESRAPGWVPPRASSSRWARTRALRSRRTRTASSVAAPSSRVSSSSRSRSPAGRRARARYSCRPTASPRSRSTSELPRTSSSPWRTRAASRWRAPRSRSTAQRPRPTPRAGRSSCARARRRRARGEGARLRLARARRPSAPLEIRLEPGCTLEFVSRARERGGRRALRPALRHERPGSPRVQRRPVPAESPALLARRDDAFREPPAGEVEIHAYRGGARASRTYC